MTPAKTELNILENYTFFVIPSWGHLLGYPTLGQYSNHNVSKITHDLVIFLSGADCSVQTEKGTLHYLFGLGYYYTKFELQSGRYITDNRQLTGLVLSDFVYDYLSTSKNITLENDRDVIVSENLFKLPIDLSFKSETKRTFIQGTLMRNLFIPYKDIILEFMDTLKNPQSFQVNKTGPIILSTHRDSYNQILISSEMDYEMKTKYLSSTAGLTRITFDSKKHLEQYFSHQNLQYIKELLLKIKGVYSTIEYDPMYLFSILVNASVRLRSEIGSSNSQKIERSNEKMPKESVLLSAESRMNSFVDWPENFKRKTKDELEKSVVQVTSKLYQPKEIDKETIRVEEFRGEPEEFKIRTMKRPIVELKPLPTIPTSNSLDILLAIKNVVNQGYDVRSIGRAIEIARDYIKSMILHSNILWEMSRFANLYQRAELNVGLSSKEKFELVELIDKWINLISKIQPS
ncbi:MAG: hypothetical protein KAW66_07370 [Candidatus Lokiarchaeota archaeon]|nr:hypothetical protein [Candidatus Lokiarchaeota archaeon]